MANDKKKINELVSDEDDPTAELETLALKQLPPDAEDPSDPAGLHRRIIAFATKAAAQPQAVTDEEVQRLRASGLTEGELIELALLVAFAKLMNTWADVSSVACVIEGEVQEP